MFCRFFMNVGLSDLLPGEDLQSTQDNGLRTLSFRITGICWVLCRSRYCCTRRWAIGLRAASSHGDVCQSISTGCSAVITALCVVAALQLPSQNPATSCKKLPTGTKHIQLSCRLFFLSMVPIIVWIPAGRIMIDGSYHTTELYVAFAISEHSCRKLPHGQHSTRKASSPFCLVTLCSSCGLLLRNLIQLSEVKGTNGKVFGFWIMAI